ncbi:tyrosine-type recombinase/integrase [Flindersiella endophytica]
MEPVSRRRPSAAEADPQPPSPAEAALLVEIKRSIGEDASGQLVEKETKTHQQRRVVVDPETIEVLRAYLVRCAERAAALQIELPKDAYLFSQEGDGSSFPDSVTQRYDRMAERLGIETTLHNLRHYSATELISAGVDLRTVAGRLGHSGGGATTLRRYAAWVAEADQRAATTLKGRMPATPLALIPEVKLVERSSASDGTVKLLGTEPAAESSPAAEQDPYHRIASDLRAAIACGALEVGDPLPTLKTLAARYSVAESTAHRAVATLAGEGLIKVARGRRAVVRETTDGDVGP